MTRLVTLSPSVPASGLSLTEKVIDRVGGSIGWACSGSTSSGRAQGVGDVELLQAGDGDDVAGLGLVDRRALDAAEGEDLRDAAVSRPGCRCRSSTLTGALALIEPEKMRPVMTRPR